MRRMSFLIFLLATAVVGLPLGATAADYCTSVDAYGGVVIEPIWLEGGVPAVIWAQGNGPDVDCVLYDENGNVIDVVDDFTDTCLLTVEPLWTGPFALEIYNVEPFDSAVCIDII